MRVEDQALLKQLLHMRKKISKIKKEEEEWQIWEARYQQRFNSLDEEPDSYLSEGQRSVSVSEPKCELQKGDVVPSKGRTLPAPGRQYRQAFIPAPMSPTSPVLSPSSSISSFTMTSNNGDSTVNDSSLLRNFSFQPLSPMDNGRPLRKSPFMTGKGVRAQSTPNCQLPPLPPPEIKQSSGPTKYGPVMKRTWSMDNVLSSPQHPSPASGDSGIDRAQSRTPSSMSSLSSEVFLDSDDFPRFETPSVSQSAGDKILASRATSDPGVDARKVQRLNRCGQGQSESASRQKISNRPSIGSQIQRLATIADERSPFEVKMMDKWSEYDGNTRFVLERRAERAMARRDMISSEPVSPSSHSPPAKPPRNRPNRGTSPTAMPSKQQRATTPTKGLSVDVKRFQSPQPQRRGQLGDHLVQFDLHRCASDDVLTSQHDYALQTSSQRGRRKSSDANHLSVPQHLNSCKSRSLDWTADVTPSVSNIQRQQSPRRKQPSRGLSTSKTPEFNSHFRFSFSLSPDAFTTEL